MNKEWKNLNKPVGYVRVYAKNLLEKEGTQTVINSQQQDVDDLPLYSEGTVIGLMKSAWYDGYTDREQELRLEHTKQKETEVPNMYHESASCLVCQEREALYRKVEGSLEKI